MPGWDADAGVIPYDDDTVDAIHAHCFFEHIKAETNEYYNTMQSAKKPPFEWKLEVIFKLLISTKERNKIFIFQIRKNKK